MTENDHLRTAVNAAVSVDTQNKTEDAFRGVAEILAGASDIGPDHELWKNWNALRLVWRSAVKDSRANARQCANFMQEQAKTFSMLVVSGLSFDAKKRVIDVFLEDIPHQMQEAKDIAQRFEYIKTEVKAFPSKVQAATTKQSCTKFWNQLCDAIKGCYLWIVKQVTKMAKTILSYLVQDFGGSISIAGVNIDLINLWKQCNKVERHCTEEAFKYHRNKLSEAGIGRLENRTTQLDANLSKQVQVWHIVEEFCITVCDQFLWEEQMSAQMGRLGIQDPILLSTHPDFTLLAKCLQAYAEGRPL